MEQLLPDTSGAATRRAAMVVPVTAEIEPGQRWHPVRRILFRFLFCYFALYSLPSDGRVNLIDIIPGISPVFNLVRGMGESWVAIHVFHLSGAVTHRSPTGSGDTALDWVQQACYLAITASAALIWSVLDRGRLEYRVLHSWLTVWIRYTLAVTLFSYGLAKVIPTQFQATRFDRLVETFGQFSPMGVLWNFMGASIPYVIFSGFAEVTGGTLLLFRRTTTLGALVSGGALLNIVLLNFCYDVPVKLYSTNLLLMALFLVSAEFRRLANVLVLNRTAAPADLSLPRLERRRMRVAAMALKVVFLGFFLVSTVIDLLTYYRASAAVEQRPPLYGMWDVETFRSNGHDVPPLTTDTGRWRQLIVQSTGVVRVRTMADALESLPIKYPRAGEMTLDGNNFTYTRPDGEHLTLKGTLYGKLVEIDLRKLDPTRFPLLARGFHWVSEQPFNH